MPADFLTIATALAVSVTAPLILVFLTGMQREKAQEREAEIRHTERLQDYARQDMVASQAVEAAKAVASHADEIAKTLRVSTKTAEVNATTTHEKLDEVQTLVNGNMTEAMSLELDATKRELALLEELIEIKPSKATFAGQQKARLRINELETRISERNRVGHVNMPPPDVPIPGL